MEANRVFLLRGDGLIDLSGSRPRILATLNGKVPVFMMPIIISQVRNRIGADKYRYWDIGICIAIVFAVYFISEWIARRRDRARRSK